MFQSSVQAIIVVKQIEKDVKREEDLVAVEEP